MPRSTACTTAGGHVVSTSRRSLALTLAGAIIAGSVVTIVDTSIAHAQSGFPDLTISVAYADNFHASGFFPSASGPWYGSPNTIWEGCAGGCSSYDGGAVLVTNNSSSSVTVSALQIAFQSCVYAWPNSVWTGSVSLAPGQNLVVAQTAGGAGNGCSSSTTSSFDMDSSDIGPNGAGWAGNCSQSGVVPQVSVTANGVSQTATDSYQLLNTGGVDLADCGSADESQPWTEIYPNLLAPSTINGGSNPSAPQLKTCNYGKRPINCATGDFWETYDELSVPGRGIPLDFGLTYNSLAASQTSATGNGWSNTYGISLSVDQTAGTATVTQEDGSTVPFTVASGSFVAPPWAPVSLTHNADGTYTFKRLQDQESFIFSSTGLLLSMSDRNHYTTVLAYNASNELTTVTDPEGRTLNFTFGANNLISQVADPSGRVVSFSYDGTNDLTSITDPLSRTTSFTYDAGHHLLTVIDPRQGVLTNAYDSLGRTTSQTDPAGLTTRFSYAAGSTTTITDPHGAVTQEHFSNDEPVTIIEPSGASWHYTYDPKTLGRTSAVDPDGHEWTYTVDSVGNVLSGTDPLGHSSQYIYNALNEPLTVTDPMGIETSFTYDANGNPLSKTVTGSGGSPVATTTYVYGDASHPGDVTQVTDPDGHVTSFTYNVNGDMATSTAHPSGTTADSTTDVYDMLGRKVCETSPNATAGGVLCPAVGGSHASGTTTWSYDADSEVTSVTDPLGNTSSYAYDANGNQTQATDSLGNVTATTYDADGRKTSVTSGYGTASAATSNYAYDIAAGSGACTAAVTGATYCSTTTGPLGALTVDYFDAQNRKVTEVIDAGTSLAQTTTNTYDLAGNLITQQTPGGLATDGYDADNRLVSVTYSQPTTGYQAAANLSYTYNANGERTQMTDGTGTTSYSYDPLGRLSSTTDGTGATTGYGYDADGNVISLTYPNGRSVSRGYDGAGEWSSVTDWQGHTTSFSYDRDGNLTAEDLGNGLQASSNYDQNDATLGGTLTRSSTTVDQSIYSRNANSQVVNDSQCGSAIACTSETYGYDPLGRVSTLQEPQSTGPIDPYSYDAAGNLTGIPGGATQSYNAASEVTSNSQGIDTVGQPVTAQVGSAASFLGVQLPSGIAPFDQIFVAVFELNTQTANTPSGYTSVGTFGSSTSGADRVQLFRRTATGGESTATVTFPAPGTVGATSIVAAVFRGVDAADPVEEKSSNGAVLPSSNTIGVPSVTTQLPSEVLLLFQGASSTGSGSFSSPGMYEAAQVATTGGASSGAGGLAESIQSAAGSSGSKAIAYSGGTAAMAGVLLALRPSVSTLAYDSAGDRISETIPGRPSPTMAFDQAGHLVTFAIGGGSYGYAYNGDGLRTVKHPPAGPTEDYTWDVAEGTPEILTDGSMNYVYGPGGLVLEQIEAPSITYVGGTTYLDTAGTATSHTISLPSGTTVGDQVIVGVTEAQNEVSSIAGFTPLGTFNQPNADRLDVYRRTVVSGDGSFTVSWQTSGSVHPKEVAVALYRGVDPNTPVDGAVVGAATSTATTSLTLGPLTTSQAPEELVLVQSAIGNASTATWSAPGMIERGASTGTQTLSSSAIADEPVSSAGSTGSRTTTLSGAVTTPQLAGALIALLPVQADFYVHDQRGTTRAITDGAGNVLASYFSGPYGLNPVASGDAGVLRTNPFTYDGEYTDAESGFVYLQNRYYDPATGQFISSDPLVDVTNQPYAYVGGDPVDNIDPSGLFCWGLCSISNAWNDTGGKAVHYVATHPKEAIGIGLGVVAVATGGAGLLVEGAAATTILSATAVGSGLGASALDYGACRSGSTAACVGAGLGFIGSIAGGGPLAASIGGIADESLAGSLLTGLLGGFSLNFGAAGLTWDISNLIANLLNGSNCIPAR